MEDTVRCKYCNTPFDSSIVEKHESECVFGKVLPEEEIPEVA